MENIFEITRSLGNAILESEVCKNMKEAEERAMKNEEATQLMGRYVELRNSLQTIMSEESPDPMAMKTISDEMDDTQKHLQNIDDVVELNIARADFNALINQVNQVLQFVVTGKISDDECCTGSCETCGGGCHIS